MLSYALKDSTRKKMASEHRAVQIAISEIANKKFGSPHEPQGIGKYQGGVRVNNCEIYIAKNVVMDDWVRNASTVTTEEQAVIEAIETVAAQIEKHGIKSIRPYFNEHFYMADPLRSMLDICGPEKPSRLQSWPEKIQAVVRKLLP